MGEDYAKLAGLTAEEDLEETTTESMKKRLPWLVILLFLGLAVSTPGIVCTLHRAAAKIVPADLMMGAWALIRRI